MSNDRCYMVVCPMARWNYENLTATIMQEIALKFQQVFKLFTFSLFVAGIRLFHSSKFRNLNISYLYIVLEFKCLTIVLQCFTRKYTEVTENMKYYF